MEDKNRFDELIVRFKKAFFATYNKDYAVEYYQGWVYFGQKRPWFKKTSLDGLERICAELEAKKIQVGDIIQAIDTKMDHEVLSMNGESYIISRDYGSHVKFDNCKKVQEWDGIKKSGHK